MSVEIRLEPPIAFIEQQSGAFRRELDDLDPLWDRFKPIMSSIVAEQFASEGHGEWPPLAESTLRQKETHGYPPTPMLRTGNLMEALVDAGRAATTSPNQMVWGTDIDYAHWHQDGGSTPGRPPQRVLLEVRTEDRRRFESAMVTWINEVARRTWGRA